MKFDILPKFSSVLLKGCYYPLLETVCCQLNADCFFKCVDIKIMWYFLHNFKRQKYVCGGLSYRDVISWTGARS